MARRKTNEEFLKQIADLPVLCLGEYITSATPIEFSCKTCGHRWFTRPNDILREHWCPICANMHRGKVLREKFLNKVLSFTEGTLLSLDVSTTRHPDVKMLVSKKTWDRLHQEYPTMGRAYAFRARRGGTYAKCTVSGVTHFVHSLILPSASIVDHINGNGLDNREVNLRPCTTAQNGANRTGLAANNTSGVTGVAWHSRDKRWTAHIKAQGRYVYLGSYVDKTQAITVRKTAEKKYFKEFAPCLHQTY